MAIAVQQLVEGTVRDSTLKFVVRGSAQTGFVVLLQVVEGSVTLQVKAPTSGSLLGTLVGTADGQPLGRTITPTLSVETLEGVIIELTGRATFRFQVQVPSDAPELRDKSFTIGDTVSGENLAPGTDVDEFSFTGRRGDELIAYLQAQDSTVGLIRLIITGPEIELGPVVLLSTATGSELESLASFRFVIPQDGEYGVRISSPLNGGQIHYVGKYRFQLRKIDRRPESAAVAALIGDTLASEAIDYIGDIDEYTFFGRVDETYNVFIQRATFEPGTGLEVEVPDIVAPSGLPYARTAIQPTDSALLERGVGRFRLTKDGEVTVRVMAATTGRSRGTYRLFVHKYNAQPESASPVVAFGATVTAERIEVPGDEDAFSISLQGSSRAAIRLRIDTRSVWARAGLNGVTAVLAPRNGGPAIGGTSYFGGIPDVAVSGSFVLPSGDWVLRVQGTETAYRGYRGVYEVSLYEILETPEGRPSTVAIGDSATEAIQPLGDIDEYTLTAAQGDHIEVTFSVLGPPAGSTLVLAVNAAGAGTLGATGSAAVAQTPVTTSTSRVTLAVPGPYSIRVSGANVANSIESGPYRFSVRRFPATPESHASLISLGADILDEALDYLGDVDQFILSGAPGSTASVYLTAGATAQSVMVEVLDPVTQALLARTQSYVARETAGPFAFPSGGAVIVRVFERRFDAYAQFRLVGSYRLEALAVP